MRQRINEIKKMWQVWTLWDAEPYEVDAVIADGEVIGYIDDDCEFCEARSEHFFNTKEEADAYVNLEKKNLPNRAKEVKNILQERWNYENQYDTGTEEITLEDFIPYDVRRHYEKEGRKRYGEIIDVLLQIIESGTFTMAGKTFRMDSVSHIEWGAWEAVIIMKSGLRIDVKDRDEYKMLGMIFDHERNNILDRR